MSSPINYIKYILIILLSWMFGPYEILLPLYMEHSFNLKKNNTYLNI